MLTQPIHLDSNLNFCLLIVTDDTDILKALSDPLSINNNFTVETTTDANSALLIARTVKPDIALLDMKPGNNI